MQMRAAACTSLIVAAAKLLCAGDKDHLQRREPQLKYDYQIKYHRLVRKILARGWQSDVALRVVALPPFAPEAVTGLLRSGSGYQAFSLRPSSQIWEASNLGLPLGYPKRSLTNVRPVFRSRPIDVSLAVRIAALYRRVLTDRRNYSTDPNIYLDTTQTTFYLAFAPGETITAHMSGWGPRTEHLLWLDEALMDYAAGKKSEAALAGEVAKREKQLRI